MNSPRACLYARYSSDKQRETSIEDQLRAARARAVTEGWDVVQVRSDEGVSGAVPFALRPGGKALLADALAGRFDILVIEGLDRAFRDLGEQEQVVKRIEHRGVRIVGTSDGYDSNAKGRKAMRFARGFVNEIYLDDLRDKTHRGLAGQFERGLSAGGRTYGYTTVDADGRGRRMVILQPEAEHVRWAFARYAEGWSPLAIVHELNRRGVPSPRGGTWAVSAVYGSAARGLGLLNNELYSGRVIWNRRQWLKDPETGKRRYVDRPVAEWQERQDDTLRIIDADTWVVARARAASQGARGAAIAASKKGGRPGRTLFGGLLVCAVCDGPMIAVNSTRYGCNNHRDRGPAVCGNTATVSREALDKRLVTMLRKELLSPEAQAELQREMRRAFSEMRRQATQADDAPQRRLIALSVEINRIVDALATIGVSQALAERLKTAEAEKARIERTLNSAPVPMTEKTVTQALASSKAMLVDLQERLETLEDRVRTRELLAELIGPVRIVRDADGVTWAEMQNPAEQLAAAGGISSLSVVAGAGFEPTTFGL